MTWFVEVLSTQGQVLKRQEIPNQASQRNAPGAGVFVLGRSLKCALVLDDAHCAAEHAQFTHSADGQALVLTALPSKNGLLWQAGRSFQTQEFKSDLPIHRSFLLGQTLLRVRHSDWPLPPERPLSRRMVWPWAALALLLVLARAAWEVWVGDTGERSIPYLNTVSLAGLGLLVWSGVYAVYGRLIGGVDRFFVHLIIGCTGFLAFELSALVLNELAFAMRWLWPLRIEYFVGIAVIAATVRMHLRRADPQHWPHMRWAVATVALLAAIIPTSQLYWSSGKLTRIQTVDEIGYPAFLAAKISSPEEFLAGTTALKALADEARKQRLDDLWGVTDHD